MTFIIQHYLNSCIIETFSDKYVFYKGTGKSLS